MLHNAYVALCMCYMCCQEWSSPFPSVSNAPVLHPFFHLWVQNYLAVEGKTGSNGAKPGQIVSNRVKQAKPGKMWSNGAVLGQMGQMVPKEAKPGHTRPYETKRGPMGSKKAIVFQGRLSLGIFYQGRIVVLLLQSRCLPLVR